MTGNRDDDEPRSKGRPKEGHILWKGVKSGVISGTSPGRAALGLASSHAVEDPFFGLGVLTIGCVGVALTVSGGIVGTFVGFGKGVVDLSTRQKLNKQELNKLHECLGKIDERNVNEQYLLLTHLKEKIREFKFKPQSKSSRELVEAIQNIPEFSSDKVFSEDERVALRGLVSNVMEVLNNYIGAEGNNGKALFVLINHELMAMDKFVTKFSPNILGAMMTVAQVYSRDNRSQGSKEDKKQLADDIIEHIGSFLEHSDKLRPPPSP